MNRRTEAITHARRQELIEDLRWLFISEPLDVVVKATYNLVRQDDGIAKVGIHVHCILGKEGSASRILKVSAMDVAEVAEQM